MTTRHLFATLLVALATMLMHVQVSAQDLQRGLRNYQEVMAGRKKLEQLSAQERQEVMIILRRI
jgi:hypothetical protein